VPAREPGRRAGHRWAIVGRQPRGMAPGGGRQGHRPRAILGREHLRAIRRPQRRARAIHGPTRAASVSHGGAVVRIVRSKPTPHKTTILPRPTTIKEARGGIGAILFGAFRVGVYATDDGDRRVISAHKALGCMGRDASGGHRRVRGARSHGCLFCERVGARRERRPCWRGATPRTEPALTFTGMKPMGGASPDALLAVEKRCRSPVTMILYAWQCRADTDAAARPNVGEGNSGLAGPWYGRVRAQVWRAAAGGPSEDASDVEDGSVWCRSLSRPASASLAVTPF
jgi:hypothetical protein